METRLNLVKINNFYIFHRFVKENSSLFGDLFIQIQILVMRCTRGKDKGRHAHGPAAIKHRKRSL